MLENLDFSSSFSPTHGHQTFQEGKVQSGVTWAKESSHEGVLGHQLIWALKELQDLCLPGAKSC